MSDPVLTPGKPRALRRVAIGCGGLALVALGAALWFDVPRFVVGLATYGGQARDGTLQVGDPAPDLPLYPLDGQPARPLGAWVGERPLVLVFGSFT